MLTYLKAKVVDYTTILAWVEQVFQDILSQHPDHHPLIARLRAELAYAHDMLADLKKRVEYRNHAVLDVVRELEAFVALVISAYLPIIQKEGEIEHFLRLLLLSTMKRCGLDWIEDIAIHLNGEHATSSPLSMVTPFISALPQHAITFSDMPGLYHEFGHHVFDKHPEIGKTLKMVVSVYYFETCCNISSLTPEQEKERDRAMSQAVEYWNQARLAEIFSDIFATFVCGPAYYVSCIDLGFRMNYGPLQVFHEDEHPPFSARISACYKSLHLVYRQELIVLEAQSMWNDYEQTLPINHEFDFLCWETLIDRIAGISIYCIQELLPGARWYDTPIPQGEKLEHFDPSMTLEDILNRGAKILFTCPERYVGWEKESFQLIRANNT